MYPKEPREESQSLPEQIGLSEILCAVFFLVCLVLSLLYGYLFWDAGVSAVLTHREAGSEWHGVVVLLLPVVSVPAFVIAVILSALASGLPWWFRIIAALLPLAGILTGLAIILSI